MSNVPPCLILGARACRAVLEGASGGGTSVEGDTGAL